MSMGMLKIAQVESDRAGRHIDERVQLLELDLAVLACPIVGFARISVCVWCCVGTNPLNYAIFSGEQCSQHISA